MPFLKSKYLLKIKYRNQGRGKTSTWSLDIYIIYIWQPVITDTILVIRDSLKYFSTGLKLACFYFPLFTAVQYEPSPYDKKRKLMTYVYTRL
jgi:uncharacterized membrane protein YhdT